MADITRADIEGAINGVTGAPTSGIVADVTPALVQAIDELINGKPVVECVSASNRRTHQRQASS